MTLTQVRRFSLRSCGHRVPRGREECPFCNPPRLSVEPLAELLRTRCDRDGQAKTSVEIASRLGMDYDSVERQIRRILSGDVTKVAFHTADNYCIALGGPMPAQVWGREWDEASPVEPYGDEEF